MVGELGQGFGACNAHTDRDARALEQCRAHLPTKRGQVAGNAR
jgi:hypothetical protein